MKPELVVTLIRYVLFSVVFLGASSNPTNTERTNKVLNTENIILTLGDINVDNNDDLEVLRGVSAAPDLDKKLRSFHDVVEKLRISESMRNDERLLPPPEIQRNVNSQLKTYEMPYRRNLKRTKWQSRLGNRKNRWRDRWVLKKREVNWTGSFDVVPNGDGDLEKAYEDFVEISMKNNTCYKYTDEGDRHNDISTFAEAQQPKCT
ncbi:hypothetical protein RUM44_001281 [Polyplax serrata]|uniref:Uncharacterized protein n=1 Tax=Polyplax serrata TaxID=468196 RepID=A0ABR1AL39_POLSC